MEGVLGQRNFKDMRLRMEIEHEVHEQRSLVDRDLEWEDLRKKVGIGQVEWSGKVRIKLGGWSLESGSEGL